MKAKIWVLGYFILIIGTLTFVGIQVIKIDPFFHYHAPYVDSYYYEIDNERSQNDGIIKHFQYDAIITGTSMTTNFKTSELDELFGTNAIKVAYSGSPFKLTHDALETALITNDDITTVVRSLDMQLYFYKSDYVDEDDDFQAPTYLYDNNILNDVHYIFNRDVVFRRVYPMCTDRKKDDFMPGITSFDDYDYTMEYPFGINSADYDNDLNNREIGEPHHLSDTERETVADNIYRNITSLAEEYPDVTFYYFIPPYSALWWQQHVNDGAIYTMIEAEKCAIEKILPADNIKLYSYNNKTDITTDINNYKDKIHYASWINSLILQWMHDGEGLLTSDNYEEYLNEELAFYSTYDYSQLANQEDYDNDYYAEALLNEELNGAAPIEYTKDNLQYIYDEESKIPALTVDDISDYKYLVFYGEKKSEQEWPSITVYTENNETPLTITANYYDSGNEYLQYLIDVSQLEGAVTIVLDDEYNDIVLY